jgi:competence protein ComEC
MTVAAIFCLAYILGLLLTAISGTLAGIPFGAIGMLGAGVVLAFSIRRVWRAAPKAWVWLAAGLVGVAAVLHFQLRLPQPNSTDICHFVPASVVETSRADGCTPSPLAKSAKAQVTGKLVSAPRLTRSNRLQFELAAAQLQSSQADRPQPVTGTLYVTIPTPAGERLYPGLTVAIEGSLYQPKPAANPGGFDFAKYLAQQGIFAGFNGTRVFYPVVTKSAPPMFWAMRQRIVQAQTFRLGRGEGELLSAMVMGKSAVDVPYEIQDQFKQMGLAHALAASGTQVSLLLSVILALTRRFSTQVQFGLGAATLLGYIGLTGIEASVLRAGIMGGVTLLALTINRKVKPVGSLIVAATALLLFNPLWIWDLGFQLSFLATLGLLVTVPIVSKWLDWLPNLIASMVAVPIAAYLWTMPLLLFVFGVISPYSVLVNILVSPLIVLISLGGMISAVAALLHPVLGSLLAWGLYHPIHLLVKIAEIGSQLPGNTFAVGTINAAQVCLLYGLIVLVWQWQRLHRCWWLAALLGLGLVMVPVGYAAAHLSQVTVLATSEKPVLVVQNKGTTGLIHSGDTRDVQFTVLPFLQKQGINQLDWAIAPSLKVNEIEAWQKITASKPINIFYSNLSSVDNVHSQTRSSFSNNFTQAYASLLNQMRTQQGVALPLSINYRMQFGSTTIEQIYTKPDILQLHFNDQTWLWLNGIPSLKRQADLIRRLPKSDVVGWSGKALSPQLLQKLQPKAAIVFGDIIDSVTQQWLTQHRVKVHFMSQGAIQWKSNGFVEMQAD